MAEDRNSNRSGKSSSGRSGGRPQSRDGKGFKPRSNGSGKSGGYAKSNGGSKSGSGRYAKSNDGDRRSFRRDGEGEERRNSRRDGESGGYRGTSNNGGNRSGKSGGYAKSGNGGYRKSHDGERRSFRRDGEGEERRNSRRNDGEQRSFRRNDGEQRSGNPRYNRDNQNFRGNAQRRNDHDSRGERREYTDEEKRQYREERRGEYMAKPRRNSDGSMSFPSQNPYTHRRPDEPKMPKGLEWSMLSTDERERLRGLSKEHAENIGLHILAAFQLEESDPDAALEHAKWVARQASRIDFARETLALVSYRRGEYKEALREFKTAYRMNGFIDYLPFIADCERGVGNPKKAIEMALGEEGKLVRGAPKAEMFLVYAGALGDLKMWDKAVEIAHTLGRSRGLPGEYRMRAVQAEQYFLEEAGRYDEAEKLDGLLDSLEDQYAMEDFDENSDDVVIDHDLAGLEDDSDVLEALGIDPSVAQYAPETESDESDVDGNDVDADDEEQLEAEEAEAGAQSDVDPLDELAEAASDTPADDAADAAAEPVIDAPSALLDGTDLNEE